MEKILAHPEYREKVAAMTPDEFKAALSQHGVGIQDAEALLRKIKEVLSGGELGDSDLECVSGGVLACYLEDKDC